MCVDVYVDACIGVSRVRGPVRGRVCKYVCRCAYRHGTLQEDIAFDLTNNTADTELPADAEAELPAMELPDFTLFSSSSKRQPSDNNIPPSPQNKRARTDSPGDGESMTEFADAFWRVPCGLLKVPPMPRLSAIAHSPSSQSALGQNSRDRPPSWSAVSIHTHTCRPACPYMSIHMAMHMSVHMSVHMYIHMSMHMSNMCLYTCLCIHQYTCPYPCLCISLYTCLYTGLQRVCRGRAV